MPPRFGWRVAAALLPLGTGIFGLLNGLSDWRHANTLPQQIAGLGVGVYGPFGALAGIALLAGHQARRPLLYAWATVITLVGGISPVAWGDESVGVGVLAAFSTAIFCAAAIWAETMAFPAPTLPAAP